MNIFHITLPAVVTDVCLEDGCCDKRIFKNYAQKNLVKTLEKKNPCKDSSSATNLIAWEKYY